MDDLFQPKSRPYLTYFNLGLEKSYEYRKTRNKKQDSRKLKRFKMFKIYTYLYTQNHHERSYLKTNLFNLQKYSKTFGIHLGPMASLCVLGCRLNRASMLVEQIFRGWLSHCLTFFKIAQFSLWSKHLKIFARSWFREILPISICLSNAKWGRERKDRLKKNTTAKIVSVTTNCASA